ncbi:MAG: glycosyltransferase family 39 protein [Candidatus Baltobacteraceae bacterium]
MIPELLALFTFLLHLAFAGNYGYFRDELYFIACARHLAWGYPDQPPLVALAALLSRPFHWNLFVLRAPVALAAALDVLAISTFVRDLGGERFARGLAGFAVALLPAYLTLGSVVTTTSFEPLSWSLVALLVVRALRRPTVSAGALLGAAIAFGAYGKYSIFLWVAALALGIALSSQRRFLLSRPALVAAAVALVALLPNVGWQALHGWPFAEVLHSDFVGRHPLDNGWQLEYHAFLANALAFTLEQIGYTNPFLVPIWVLGILAALRSPALRFLGIAALFTIVVALALEAKGYYIIGMYGTFVAIGCYAMERATRRHLALRVVTVVTLGVSALAILPFAAPILPIDRFVAYSTALHLTGTNGTKPQLIQPLFAEEFGWQRLAEDVARIYRRLPPALRERTAVYADTYADAGAIDRFGARYGLPAAIGSQNGYWLWGMRGYDMQSLLAVGASRERRLFAAYARCRVLGTTFAPLRAVVEGPTPIFLCTHPRLPRAALWRSLRWYGA